VSPPLAAQTISGTFNMMVGLSVSGGFFSNNHSVQIHVYVTQGDSDTPRGDLLTNFQDTSQQVHYLNGSVPGASDTAYGLALSASQALSSLTVSAGDRIVIEIGIRRNAATTALLECHVGYGGFVADLQAGQFYAEGLSFFEFQNDLTFEPEETAVTSGLLEYLLPSAGEEALITSALLEYLMPSAGPQTSRITRQDLTRGTGRIIARLTLRETDAAGNRRTYRFGAHPIPDRGEAAEPRIVSFGDYERTASDDDGALRINSCRVVVADIPGPGKRPDYLLRSKLNSPLTYGVINQDVEIEWMLEEHWRINQIAPGTYRWAKYFRGEVARYQAIEGYLFQLELKGCGSRRADREIALPLLADDFQGLPAASLKLHAPFVLGRKSDAGSEADPPMPTVEADSGAYNGPDLVNWPLVPVVSGPLLAEGKGGNPRAGFAELGGTILTGLTVTENASGLGDFSGAGQLVTDWYGMATFTPTGGSEGDPDTFLPRDCQHIGGVADDSVIDMACDAAGIGGTYHFYLGAVFSGNGDIRWLQRIDTTSPTASFNRANWGVGGRQEDEHVSDGAVRISNSQADGYIAKRVYAVVDVWDDGTTSIGALILGIQDGYRRPFRFTVTPRDPGVIERHVLRSRDGASGTLIGVTSGLLTWRFGPEDFEREYVLPSTQVNGAGDEFFENDPLDASSGQPVTSFTAPVGRLPIVLLDGAYSDALGIATDWRACLISYGWSDGDTVDGVFAAGSPIPTSEFDAGGRVAVPGLGDWEDLFGPTEYLERNGRRYWVIYVRASYASDAVSGDRPITVNVTRALRNGIDQLALVIDNFMVPDQVQPVDGGDFVSTIPTWSDGVARRDAASFATAKAEVGAVLQSGLNPGYYLPASETRPSCGAVLQALLPGLEVGLFWDIAGSVGLIVHPPVPLRATFRQSWDHVTEILDGFHEEDDEQPRANRIVYEYDYDDLTGSYRGSGQVDNLDARAAYRDFDPIVTKVSFPTAQSATVSRQLAYRFLARRAKPVRTLTIPRAFHGIHDEIGTRAKLTHPEGMADGGYLGRRTQVRSVLANIEDLTVTFRAHDLDWINLTRRHLWVLLEDNMARDLGGNRHTGCVLDEDGNVRPYNWKTAPVDWPVLAATGVTFTGLVRLRVSTASGSVTPKIYRLDEDGKPDLVDGLIATGTAVTSSTLAYQEITFAAEDEAAAYGLVLELSVGLSKDDVVCCDAALDAVPEAA
jgi:hypothetical protein